VILSPGRGQPTVSLKRLRIERLPGDAKGLAVRLRFVLTGSARVTFSVFGPAPSCSVAGRFTIMGHAGLNSVPFRGRIGGRLLPRGIYTIVPQSTVRASSLRGPRVAIMIDARGVHPATPVPVEHCLSATSPGPLLPLLSRHAGVAGAIYLEPVTPTDVSVDKPKGYKAWILPGGGEASRNFAILMLLLASAMLFALTVLEPLYALERFRLVRAHRGQVAFSGAAFLATAGLLFLVWRL
jgi:hypothetical protein